MLPPRCGAVCYHCNGHWSCLEKLPSEGCQGSLSDLHCQKSEDPETQTEGKNELERTGLSTIFSYFSGNSFLIRAQKNGVRSSWSVFEKAGDALRLLKRGVRGGFHSIKPSPSCTEAELRPAPPLQTSGGH